MIPHKDLTQHKNKNPLSYRADKYRRYFQQIKCLNKQLQGLFDAMRSSKIYDSAIIIIHGDHGSRIWIREPGYINRNELTPEDLLDNYSTLFAVKAGGYEAGYDLRVLSLNQIFSQLAGQIFKEEKNIVPHSPYVYLSKKDSKDKKKETLFRWPYSVYFGLHNENPAKTGEGKR